MGMALNTNGDAAMRRNHFLTNLHAEARDAMMRAAKWTCWMPRLLRGRQH